MGRAPSRSTEKVVSGDERVKARFGSLNMDHYEVNTFSSSVLSAWR